MVTTKFSQTRWLQDARVSSSAVLAYAAATCCFERIHIIAAVVFYHLSPTMPVGSRYEVEELTLSACGQLTWLVGLFFSYSEWILLHPVAKGNGIWMFFFLFFSADPKDLGDSKSNVGMWQERIVVYSICLFSSICLLVKYHYFAVGFIWFHHPYKNHMER